MQACAKAQIVFCFLVEKLKVIEENLFCIDEIYTSKCKLSLLDEQIIM